MACLFLPEMTCQRAVLATAKADSSQKSVVKSSNFFYI